MIGDSLGRWLKLLETINLSLEQMVAQSSHIHCVHPCTTSLLKLCTRMHVLSSVNLCWQGYHPNVEVSIRFQKIFRHYGECTVTCVHHCAIITVLWLPQKLCVSPIRTIQLINSCILLSQPNHSCTPADASISSFVVVLKLKTVWKPVQIDLFSLSNTHKVSVCLYIA